MKKTLADLKGVKLSNLTLTDVLILRETHDTNGALISFDETEVAAMTQRLEQLFEGRVTRSFSERLTRAYKAYCC